MRLHPPAPIITRTAIRDFELSGHPVAEGTVLYVPIHAVHHHTALWENPEAFDADRFAPAAGKVRHRYAYMPFGAGPRVCIGNAFAVMEAFAMMAVLLPAFKVTAASGSPPQPIMKVTLRPKQTLSMRVEERRPGGSGYAEISGKA